MTHPLQKALLICIVLNVLRYVICNNNNNNNNNNQYAPVLGVSKKGWSKYSGETFTCFDSSKTISKTYINDNFCDCDDGSDEPGTSACPNGQFYCANRGYKPLKIASSHVQDGICDCCDGSDEAAGHCKNTCDALGAEIKKSILEQIAKIEEGVKIRQEYVTEGETQARQKQSELEEYNVLLSQRNQELDQIKAKKEAEELIEKAENEKIQNEWRLQQELLAANSSANQSATDSGNAATVSDSPPVEGQEQQHQPTQQTEQQQQQQQPESKTADSSFPYPAQYAAPPTASDTPVNTEPEKKADTSSSFPYPAQYAAPPATTTTDTAASDLLVDDDGDATGSTTTHSNSDIDDDLDSIPSTNANEHGATDTTTTTNNEAPKPPADITLPGADQARQEYQSALNARDEVQTQYNQAKKFLDTDYGPNRVFAALHGECFSVQQKQYTYEMCPYDRAAQKEGSSSTSLGNWEKYNSETQTFQFSGGATCWNGPARSLSVKLVCSSKNEAFTVEEPSRCVYSMKFGTSAVCEQGHADVLKLNLQGSLHDGGDGDGDDEFLGLEAESS